MATTEGFGEGFEIKLKEFNNDYEQLRRKSGQETPYSTYTKQDEEDTNHVNTESGTLSDYEKVRRKSGEETPYSALMEQDVESTKDVYIGIRTTKNDYEKIRRNSEEETPYSAYTKQDEEHAKVVNIKMGTPRNDYEKLRTKTREETPYCTYQTENEEDTNNLYTEIGSPSFSYSTSAPEINSLQPLVPTQTFCNRKKIGQIVAICVGLITIISVSVVIFVFRNGTENNVESWLSWGMWSVCSVTCGAGIHVRYRRCSGKAHEGCHGKYKEVQECFRNICPVYGIWTIWSSWGDCNVTCGDGRQTRTRTCSKLNTTNIDCVGKHFNEQNCNSGICPDCSTVCKSGTLHLDCTACICNQIITGRVVTSSQAPLQNVSLYVNNAAADVIATTNSFGEFQLSNVCLNSTILYIKKGFAELSSKVTTTSINITLRAIELPYITVEPQPKSRLTGENVTLCCSAQSNPGIKYYEWFKYSNVLDERLYSNGTMLLLTSLNSFDTGKYSCRANSAYGSIKSSVADLVVKDNPNGFCLDAYEQRRIELPYDCIQHDTNTSSIEVGDCKPKLCRLSSKEYETPSCRDETQSCCSISDFEMLTVQCTGYQLSVMKANSCGCGTCDLSHVKIIGTVLMYPSRKIAKYFQVHLNGKFKTYTNSRGSFKVSVDKNYGSAVLTVFGVDGGTATKVVYISDSTKGTIYTTVYVAQVTSTIQFDPTKEIIIDIGKDLQDAENSVAELHIPKYAFADSLYRLQTATVTLSISYLDAKNVTDMDKMPGFLYHVNQRGETESLNSFGSFYVTAYASQTREILSVINKINVVIGNRLTYNAKDVSLYKLNTVSGYWDNVNINDNVWGTLDSLVMSSWITVGQLENSKATCYFNVRVYEDSTLTTQITNSRYPFFLQAVHTTNHSSFETYGHTFSPSSSCFQTICNGNSGYIELWISNIEKGSDEYLLPADTEVYADIGFPIKKQNVVNYFVTHGDEHLSLSFINSTDGPFYNSRSSCLADNDAHFKFYFNGSIRNVFTLKPFYDVYSDNSENNQYISKRVWYQQRAEGYRVCFVKAKFNTQSEKMLRIRATSYGGTNANITGEILGIREEHILLTSTICLEYKCSGTINEQFSWSEYDNTRVSISTHEPCSVESFSQPLIDKFSDINLNNTAAGTFSFYAPTVHSPKLGIYSASSNSGDIASARTVAKGECRSGKPMDYSSDNPDTGLAVTFLCTRK
ncbi:cartilage intermediate layer protein 1-like isoform X2 [Mercenaria mercenaria]|uniref:cartilage intermediate layer protein 1-like isoform X2 n=1 Tax=Mercenaria mercenaria TaxID=6596 RepID=UPI00234F7030|nr:cartilage intermediate layer protein 1-like isoform X2 [Mercenaria mercenaria]